MITYYVGGALTDGLVATSKERCNAIKNEHPEFAGFFEHINELSSLFTREALNALWQKTIDKQSNQSFDSFVKRLEQVGVITPKKDNKKYDHPQYVGHYF